MNILIVSDVSIEHVIGGAERVLREQTTGVAQKGHHVVVLTRRIQTHNSHYAYIQGVHEWRYDVNQNNAVSFLLSSIINAQKLYKTLHKDTSFDLINYHQPVSAFAIHLTKESKHIPKIYTCHSLSFEEYQTRQLHRKKMAGPLFYLQKELRKHIEKTCLASCQKIIVLSQYTCDKLMHAYKIPLENICIIPGAVDLKKFQPPSNKNELRQKMGVPLDRLVLFTARNLVPRMGLENLLEAMALVILKIPDALLYIAGDGVLKEKLQSLIHELKLEQSVKLLGYLSDEILVHYFQMGDFFILPTIDLEGFGLVTVESMACGVPVLGTPIGGTQEILGRLDKSLLFENTTPEAIARLILEKYKIYISHPEQYQKLSFNCRRFVEENYSWTKNIDETIRTFSQCAASAEK